MIYLKIKYIFVIKIIKKILYELLYFWIIYMFFLIKYGFYFNLEINKGERILGKGK